MTRISVDLDALGVCRGLDERYALRFFLRAMVQGAQDQMGLLPVVGPALEH